MTAAILNAVVLVVMLLTACAFGAAGGYGFARWRGRQQRKQMNILGEYCLRLEGALTLEKEMTRGRVTPIHREERKAATGG